MSLKGSGADLSWIYLGNEVVLRIEVSMKVIGVCQLRGIRTALLRYCICEVFGGVEVISDADIVCAVQKNNQG